MEKNQKFKTQDLQDKVMFLADLAGKCYRLGLIDDYSVTIDIRTEADYTIEVRVDCYTSTERRWKAKANSYNMSEDHVDDDTMTDYLTGLIENRRASIMAELEILEG